MRSDLSFQSSFWQPRCGAGAMWGRLQLSPDAEGGKPRNPGGRPCSGLQWLPRERAPWALDLACDRFFPVTLGKSLSLSGPQCPHHWLKSLPGCTAQWRSQTEVSTGNKQPMQIGEGTEVHRTGGNGGKVEKTCLVQRAGWALPQPLLPWGQCVRVLGVLGSL